MFDFLTVILSAAKNPPGSPLALVFPVKRERIAGRMLRRARHDSTIIALAFIAVFSVFSPASAQTAKPAPAPAYSSQTKLSSPAATPPAWLANATAYALDDCEFQMSFPEEPYRGKRCDPLDPTNCSDATTFTKVYGLDAAIAYTVSCNPTPQDMYDKYSDNVMKTALFAMAQPSHLDKAQTGFGILPQAKMAVLLGSGKTANGDDLLYTGQIWVGHKSILTIEGKLSGKYNPDSDKLFAEILKTARIKDKPADKSGDKKASAK